MRNIYSCYRLIAVLLFFTLPVSAQYYPNYSIPVSVGTKNLPLAWVGGLNNPQFSAADLNNDGIKDLVIFDREGNKFLTFLNNNTPNTVSYTYAPKYELNFPEITDWALLVDFNHDNIADIFAHTTLGIQVFKGYYNSEGELSFSLYYPLLYFFNMQSYVNLLVSSVDIPAIVDVDNDGDLDVLTFDQFGGFVSYFKNLSEEKGYGTDTLTFTRQEYCWGKFFEPANRRAKELQQPCPWRIEEGVRHSGSTLLAFDNDKDGDKEMVLGDLGFDNLVYLLNGGDSINASMTWQDTLFPSYSHSADIPSFPAAFYLDLDNDGLNDIVASPNQEFGSQNIANVWYYKNMGTPDTGIFIYQSDSLLTKDMIEVGEGSAPVLVKLDNDSLYDMVVANRNYYNSYSQLAYFKNTGTKNNPAFKLLTRDYMTLSDLHLRGLYPAFGDLDNDGDNDMILGDENGTLLYYKNIAASGNPASFALISPIYDSIDVGSFSTPQLVDVNKDGLLDLLIGCQLGKLFYFQNTGTLSSPVFSKTPTSSFFGGVDVQQDFSITGFSVPYLTRLNGSPDYTLLVGCEGGNIFRYDNIDNNLGGNFTLTDTTFSGIKTGSFSAISGADINNDGVPEFVIGNYRGGVTAYDTALIHSLGTFVVSVAQPSLQVFPNPSAGKFTVEIINEKPGGNALFQVLNIFGQQVRFRVNNKGANRYELNLNGNAPGIYFCKIRQSTGSFDCKLVLVK